MSEPGEAATAGPTPSAPAAKAPGKVALWFTRIRTNSRLGYLLQIGARVLTSAMNLIWIRLLVGAMGKPLNGLYLAFASVFALGGLGDLGMGVAISIRTGRYMGAGREKEQEMQKFLATARALYLTVAVIAVGVMVLLSPWAPHWLHFPFVPDAGSMDTTFIVGAFMIGMMLLYSYTSNINYACGNIAWPALPDFCLLQASLCTHWLLARHHQPLWMQFLPYLAGAGIKVWLMWFYVRVSHRPLSVLWPIRFDWSMAKSLFEGSLWVYFCSLGNLIYRNTDALVINAGFPPGTLPDYNYNYKFCELMVLVVATASFVVLPKMTEWMASTNPQDQQRVRVEMRRVNQFQSLLGCGAALAYLALNTLFIKIWFLHKADPILPAPLILQLAFALNLAVTTCGDITFNMTMRSGDKGLRFVGAMCVVTGLLNLGLSLLAMRLRSLQGIALATVLAQSVMMVVCSLYLCRHLKISWLPWAFKCCILPLIAIGFAGWLRIVLPMDSISHAAMLIVAYAVMFILAAWALGVNWAIIKEELKIFRKLLGK